MYFDIPELPQWVLTTSQYMLAVAIVLSTVRLIKGPTLLDRIIALDLIAALTIAQCVVLTLVSGFIPYLDIAIAIALISFIATVALVRYLERKDL